MSIQTFDYTGTDFEPLKYPKTINDINLFAEKMLTDIRPCGNLEEKHGRLNIPLIQRILNDQFSSFISMKAVECMIDNHAFLSQLSRAATSYVDVNKQWLEKDKLLCSGTYGMAMKVKLTSDPVLQFVCKTPLVNTTARTSEKRTERPYCFLFS